MMKFIAKIKYRLMSPRRRAEYLKNNRIIDIGNDCEVYSSVIFGSEPYLIKIGNKVRVTDGVKFVTHDGGMWVIRNLGWNQNADKMDTITIGNNVFIGIESIIMPGVTIGSNVLIGAGSIVSKDVPDNSVYAGVPAKRICSIKEYYNNNSRRIFETKHLTSQEKKEFYLKKFKSK